MAAALLAKPVSAQQVLSLPVGEPPVPVGLEAVLNDDISQEEALEWATILGKALFWDQQISSDGAACASCHYAAGGDIRVSNQLNPGTEAKFGPDLSSDTAFGGTLFDASGGVIADGVNPLGDPIGPNYTMTEDDFPFRHYTNPLDRTSDITYDLNDRMGSQGSYEDVQVKTRVNHLFAKEKCDINIDTFHMEVGRKNKLVPTRATATRNAPTTINAGFLYKNFWDGRASNIFNGFNPFGDQATNGDPTLRPLVGEGFDVALADEPLAIGNASLASQAVGPPLSDLEMSCGGRMWPFIGAKMLSPLLTPLSGQKVSVDDSILGPYSNSAMPRARREMTGLQSQYTYRDLIMKAFDEKYWGGFGFYEIDDDGELVRTSRSKGFSQAEMNFSMFFGISVMLYERTLVSDESRFDTAIANGCVDLIPGGPGGGTWVADRCVTTLGSDGQPLLTQEESDGARLFTTFGFGPAAGANCTACHVPATMFMDAAFFEGDEFDVIDAAPFAGGAAQDQGWNSIGGRPLNEDLGLGAGVVDGVLRSAAQQARQWLIDGLPAETKPHFYSGPDDPEICDDFPSWIVCDPENGVPADQLPFNEVIGGMKTPSIRNVALTPPYFSYGGYANLDQLMEFYVRGGNRREVGFAADGVTECGPNDDDSGAGVLNDKFPLDEDECPGTGVPGVVTQLDLVLDAENGKDQEYGMKAIVAFMKAWTDPRVQCDAEPFDHPELFLTHGHDKRGRDIVARMPAVGSAGYAEQGQSQFCLPNSGDLFAPGMQNRVDPTVAR